MGEPAAEPTQMRLEFEGVLTTDHRLNLGGNIEISPALAKRLSLSSAEVVLELVVEPASFGVKRRKDEDGNIVGVTLSRNVVVTSVREVVK